MSENDPTAPDALLGEALRSLAVEDSRVGFWDDIDRDLRDVDLASSTGGSSGLATAGDEQADDVGAAKAGQITAPAAVVNEQAGRKKPPAILAVAAALLLVVGGFVWALRPQQDQTTELQTAGREESVTTDEDEPVAEDPGESNQVDAGDDEPAPTEAAGGADVPGEAGQLTGASVDVSQIASEAALPLAMEPLAGSETSDVTLFAWDLPQSPLFGCGTAGGRRAMVPLDSAGTQVGPIVNVGYAPTIVEGPRDQIAVVEWCEGDIWALQVGTFASTGEVEINRWLNAPESYEFSQFAPVWSPSGEQLHVHIEDAAGVLWTGTYDIATGDVVEIEQAAGRVLAQLSAEVFVVATSRAVFVGDQQLLELDPQSGGANAVLVEVSTDGGHVAVASGDEVVLADETGQLGHFIGYGQEILAMDWSGTGQLVFSAAGSPTLFSYGLDQPSKMVTVAMLPGDWSAIEFSDDGEALALFGTSPDDPSQPRTQVVRFVSADSEARGDSSASRAPFGTLELTVGDQALALRGIGAIESGMTVAEAEAAVGGTLVEFSSAGGGGCAHALLAGDPNSPSFMVLTYREDGPDLEWSDGIVARIEISGDAATLSGISVASSKAEVLAAYGDRIEITPHNYTAEAGGEYLTFVPISDEDSQYRLVMETFEDRVTTIRSGLLPAVEWVEGCA